MTYDEKIAALSRIVSERQEKASNVFPPLHRFLRTLGFHPIPPIFRRFWMNAFFLGSVFGLCWSLLMSLLSFWRQGSSIGANAVTAVMAGLLWGLLMSWFVEQTKRRLSLGRWHEFPDGNDDTGD